MAGRLLFLTSRPPPTRNIGGGKRPKDRQNVQYIYPPHPFAHTFYSNDEESKKYNTNTRSWRVNESNGPVAREAARETLSSSSCTTDMIVEAMLCENRGYTCTCGRNRKAGDREWQSHDESAVACPIRYCRTTEAHRHNLACLCRGGLPSTGSIRFPKRTTTCKPGKFGGASPQSHASWPR